MSLFQISSNLSSTAMLNRTEIVTVIKSIPWFFDLSSESINRLSTIGSVVSFKPGEILFNEGERHANFYIVIDGKISVESFVPGRGKTPLFIAESLDVLGWSGLTPVVRQITCTASALSPANLLMFNTQALMACCESDYKLGFVIMRRLANIVAWNLLTHRLQLLEIMACEK